MKSLFGFAVLVLLCAKSAGAQGMDSMHAAPVFQSEGRNPVVFSATCTTSAWTLVVSSDAIARSTLIVAVSSNTSVVCVQPTAATSSSSLTGANNSGCFSYTPGTELPANNSSLTDYSRAAWWCRAAAGVQNLKGYRTRDKGDLGAVSDPAWQ